MQAAAYTRRRRAGLLLDDAMFQERGFYIAGTYIIERHADQSCRFHDAAIERLLKFFEAGRHDDLVQIFGDIHLSVYYFTPLLFPDDLKMRHRAGA